MKGQKKINNNTEKFLLGEELLSEAAAALFEEPARIARDISPEEALEFEELRNIVSSGAYSYKGDDTLSIAAEDETPYGEDE